MGIETSLTLHALKAKREGTTVAINAIALRTLFRAL
jgi:hypothetical protein